MLYPYLNFGTGHDGGGSHDNPIVSRRVSADATARAAGEGTLGDGGICWPRLCLIGDPTQSCEFSNLRIKNNVKKSIKNNIKERIYIALVGKWLIFTKYI